MILPDLVGNDPMLVTFPSRACAAAILPSYHCRHGFRCGARQHAVSGDGFVSGKSLQELLAEEAMPPRRALELMNAISAGVAAAHG